MFSPATLQTARQEDPTYHHRLISIFLVNGRHYSIHRLKAYATLAVPRAALTMPTQHLYYERNLPHWLREYHELFVTWRLAGSLPRAVLQSRGLRGSSNPGREFVKLDRMLDSALHGPAWLRQPEIASLVVTALHRGSREMNLFELLAFVVIPNHVHILIRPHVHLSRITQGIKGSTAHAANQILGRTGQVFWQRESFDHWSRTEAESSRISDYIERNPVQAGLAKCPQGWPWSSASSKTGFQPV